MRFTRSDRVIFGKDTLAEVICQIRFPTILAIGTKPPDAFQDIIRADYPVYRRQTAVSGPGLPDLAPMLQQLPSPPDFVTHWFESDDAMSIISLTSDFLAVTSKQYHGWDTFREEIARAVAALEEIYVPAFYERVGLRYLDEVDRTELGLENRPWSALLEEGMVSLLGADLGIDLTQDQIRTQALLHLDDVEGGLVRLQHGVGNGGDVYTIDADFYQEGHTQRGDLFDTLDKFHEEEGHLFRWAISPELSTALEPRPPE